MPTFILIITVLMADGREAVSVAKFDNSNACIQALVEVLKASPGVTATCKRIDP